MVQGIVGIFLVRISVAFLMSRVVPAPMFHIGQAPPCSTVLQVIFCLSCQSVLLRQRRRKRLCSSVDFACSRFEKVFSC